MKENIFVTGATGNVGQQVIKQLLARDYYVTAAKRPHNLVEDSTNLEYRLFDFTDPGTWESALQGVSGLFLMRPPYLSNIKRDMLPFLKFLKQKKIGHVVFLSVQGADKNSFIPHNKVEHYLKELEIPYTFIRPSFFMQNLTTTHLPEIRDEQIFHVPTGKGKTNYIDVRNIGEIIALMFENKKHLNQAYTITGEISYSSQEIAEKLSQGLGRTIEFTNPRGLSFVFYHLKRGRKLSMALVMLTLYSIVKNGKADSTTNTSRELLGKEPISLEQFIEDHKSIFLGEQ